MTEAAAHAAQRDRFFEATLDKADPDIQAAVAAELGRRTAARGPESLWADLTERQSGRGR